MIPVHPPKKSVRMCVRLILVLVWKKIVLVLVWGTSERLVPAEKKQNAWYQRALRCQLRGRPFHPWAGRLRFSGEAHPGPATLTQSSSFSCGAGLQIESRLLLCCAPAVYMLADAAAVAAAVFGLEHLISYCNYTKRIFGPTSRGQGRRLCHAMPNYSGEVNPEQQLPFCCRAPCESRNCCAAVAVPSRSELPSSLMLIQYIIRARHLLFFSLFFYLVSSCLLYTSPSPRD